MVGSGPGGGLLAHYLALSGKKVIVVEAGPKLGPADFHQDVGKTLASYFWEGGARTVRGNIAFPTLQARALGGGSVFNSAICMRPTAGALEKWRDDYGLTDFTEAGLAPHFDAVERFMNIKATDDDVMGRRNELFREACESLGWSWDRVKRFEEGCRGSGECITGCRNEAKNSTDRRGIREVAAAGGRVYTSVNVDELIVENGKVRGILGSTVDPKTWERKHPVRITASATILCAGAINTPIIMRKSGLRREAIGSNLIFHPSCYVIGVFDETVNPFFGATQGMHTTEHLERGIKLEALWATAATFSRSLPRGPKQFKRYLKRWPNMAVWDGWISSEASFGQVRALPGTGRPDISYNFADPDVRRLQEANALLCEMFAAAGSKEVIPAIRGLPEVMDPAEAAREIRLGTFGQSDLPTASNHVMGGSAMGVNPDRGAVCDGWGKVFDADDLYVCDTGLYPSSPGVNPQLTVMALAHRLGMELPNRY